jgi:hypothetical protein
MEKIVMKYDTPDWEKEFEFKPGDEVTCGGYEDTVFTIAALYVVGGMQFYVIIGGSYPKGTTAPGTMLEKAGEYRDFGGALEWVSQGRSITHPGRSLLRR